MLCFLKFCTGSEKINHEGDNEARCGWNTEMKGVDTCNYFMMVASLQENTRTHEEFLTISKIL